MAINATNYDGTKDYKIAEIGDVYHPNLLVNGDFQINQRGQTSYSNESLTPAYTLDMWYSIKATITKTDSGVTVSANKGQEAYLMQKIPCNNTKKTIVAKVNGKIYSTIFTGSKATIQLDSSVGSIHAQYVDSKYMQVGFIINSGKTANIEYCDLFEGDIAYPHVRENIQEAEIKCKRFLQVFKFPPWTYVPCNVITADHFSITIPLSVSLYNKKPTITISNHTSANMTLHNYADVGISALAVGGEVGSESVLALYGNFTKQVSVPSQNGTSFGVHGNNFVIYASCEPL